MLREARRLNPHLDFRTGTMTALDLGDGEFTGVCAWYSAIHIPDGELPRVFAEFHRVLAGGGHLLLAFQVGDQPLVLTEAFGESVDVTYHRRRPDDVISSLERCGFAEVATLVRQPDGDGIESTPQAFVVVRKT
jgi:SAM-dependent methyltransferase